MKQIALILLIGVYSLSIFGVGIKKFYCCGKLESTSISFLQEDSKKCMNGDESDGCCKTKYQVFKVKDSHFASEGISNPAKFLADLHLLTPTIEIAALATRSKSIANAIHAPPKSNVPIYVFNCVYRI